MRAEGHRTGWGPVADGEFITKEAGAPSLSADIPMIIGSNATERTVALWDANAENMSEQELRDKLAHDFPANADEVYRVFRQQRPNAKPIAIYALVSSWGFVGSSTVRQIHQRNAQGGPGPTYRYEFAWYTPALDARPRAYHCAELPFVFNNVERTNASAAGGEDAAALAQRMSASWVAFARTGNPNHSGIPQWNATSSAAWPTMVFGSEVTVRDDRQSPELQVLEASERGG